MTPAERLLLLLVADALLVADTRQMLGRDLRLRLRDARHAMDDEAHAAPGSALQGGQGAPRSSGSGEALYAASDAHSPGAGRVLREQEVILDFLRRIHEAREGADDA
jgi:hypothetical protein